jgi:hypothetical protein
LKKTMLDTTIPSQEFDHNPKAARKAASKGLVFITDLGKPTHVLMAIERYRSLVKSKRQQRTLLELMDAMPNAGDFEFDAPRIKLSLSSP